MRNEMRSLRRIFGLGALSISLFITSTAPAQSLDLGPSSTYLVQVSPAAKATIEKTLGAYGGKIEKKYQYVFD